MPGFPGFDTSEFPGNAEMAWLRANTNLRWCGYYLGPAPSHASTSWMGTRAALQAAGWGIAPVYVGQQIAGPGRHNVSASQGTIDGNDAAALMRREGFPAGSCVYLDLEDGPPFSAPRTNYVAAWVDAVAAAGLQAGVYCSHGFAEDVHALRPDARVWAFKVETAAEHPFPGVNFPDLHPAGCGYTGAFIWQLGQNCRLNLQTTPLRAPLVDLDTALTPDPGAP
ncbi:glycoside hydrolase domain-containing protein [Limobrevibacterium gyesilva]|uniref:DUF1906 domain-containing protein n=1 Tax=Limobrevibacterium gyesilva TaxID=2991712 RepID=A0AA41YRE8_9PROT|nr:glycoside hydrolase domain-containing protein [Limobrevibacterium gyesilva]MCW3477341.1 DUF1906 domain-containing protein [Limobrevibacterium gyesilva]